MVKKSSNFVPQFPKINKKSKALEPANYEILSISKDGGGEISLEGLSGPVGIAQIAGDSASAGLESLFFLIAIIARQV